MKIAGSTINTYLTKQGSWESREEAIQYFLLKYLRHSEEPVGAWVLKVMLDLKDIEVSVATVGRSLKRLDSLGYTRLVGTRGRVITKKGIAYVEEKSDAIEREQLQVNLIKATKPKTFEELLDVLRTKKVLECEAARLAAIRADSKDIQAIEESMERHERRLASANDDATSTSLDFHRKVAMASKNNFLIASLDLLIYEEIKLESQLADLMLRSEKVKHAQQHRLIANAIIAKSAEEAAYEMGIHFNELIKAIKEQYYTDYNMKEEL